MVCLLVDARVGDVDHPFTIRAGIFIDNGDVDGRTATARKYLGEDDRHAEQNDHERGEQNTQELEQSPASVAARPPSFIADASPIERIRRHLGPRHARRMRRRACRFGQATPARKQSCT